MQPKSSHKFSTIHRDAAAAAAAASSVTPAPADTTEDIGDTEDPKEAEDSEGPNNANNDEGVKLYLILRDYSTDILNTHVNMK
ncbi:hypothetical protein N7491_005934 [Penicillium cf. griseofulvum]|nr:hypothetical protein N7491_005934 [Penicillium cf. griseofulvum]KAJ5453170.1 hypothetical protein N7445_001353 [Penicillium cf. griseofulvum]